MHARRWPTALSIAALAASAGISTCALAPEAALNRAEEMAIQALGFELFLGLTALAGAALSAMPVRERLDCARGDCRPGCSRCSCSAPSPSPMRWMP